MSAIYALKVFIGLAFVSVLLLVVEYLDFPLGRFRAGDLECCGAVVALCGLGA